MSQIYRSPNDWGVVEDRQTTFVVRPYGFEYGLTFAKYPNEVIDAVEWNGDKVLITTTRDKRLLVNITSGETIHSPSDSDIVSAGFNTL